MWAEDCKLNKPMILISRGYHAIVNDIAVSNRAGSLGKIVSFNYNGRDVTVVLDEQLIPYGPEPEPTYRRISDDEILSVRMRKYWPKSEEVYASVPRIRPPSQVYIDKERLGVRLHRCRNDEYYVEGKMKQVLKDSENGQGNNGL